MRKGGVSMDKQEKLKELTAKLEELKGRDPSHCSGTETFVGHTGHTMSPELFQQIEALEEEIKKLKKELK
jgi:benzoyl-CoA reductase/2-hydroxyglutaryl-CoA dehydratase subunit BcrC/BadD/HgdB